MPGLHGQRKAVVEELRDFAGELDTFAVLAPACWPNHRWVAFGHSFVVCTKQ
jgi:hypothetical protein